jgi:transposase
MPERSPYPSDLSDLEYALIEDSVPQPKHGGRPAKYERREIVNGVRYVLRTGCAWRLLPHDLPKWNAVYHYFALWKSDGTWKRIHDELHGDLRQSAGRNREPSAAIIDSQSVKTTEKGGPMATTRARKSTGESGISSSIRSGC